jgi:hypothetical protein
MRFVYICLVCSLFHLSWSMFYTYYSMFSLSFSMFLMSCSWFHCPVHKSFFMFLMSSIVFYIVWIVIYMPWSIFHVSYSIVLNLIFFCPHLKFHVPFALFHVPHFMIMFNLSFILFHIWRFLLQAGGEALSALTATLAWREPRRGGGGGGGKHRGDGPHRPGPRQEQQLQGWLHRYSCLMRQFAAVLSQTAGKVPAGKSPTVFWTVIQWHVRCNFRLIKYKLYKENGRVHSKQNWS